MMHVLHAAAPVLLLGFLAPSPFAQESAAPTAAQVDALFAPWDRPDAPGVAVAVVCDGKVVHEGGYGRAQLEHAVPITPETVFDIASVSKQFAGFSIALLIEAGLLTVDYDVRVHLPELPRFGPTIRLRHLVHHTSGIRDWPGTFMLAGKRMDDVIAFAEILDLVWRQRELNFEPGSEYLYSNTGYNLLAEIVARVTERSFREFTREELFVPRGMLHTHFQTDHREVIPGRAYGYEPRPAGGWLAVHDGLTAQGSSSLFSTVRDLAKWAASFDDPFPEEESAVARMHERGVLNDGSRIAYAYGVGHGTYRGLRTVGHSGAWAGFRSELLRVPAHRFAVVVLSNTTTCDAGRLARGVVDLYLAAHLEPVATPAPTLDTAPVKAADVPRDVLDEYAGTYRLGRGWLVTITREGGGLFTQATAENRFPMRALSREEFHVDAYGASFTFRRDASGAVTRLLYKDLDAPRVPPFRPSPEALAELVGVYVSPELDTKLDLTVRDGKLVAWHPRHGEVVLHPTEADEFRTTAWWMKIVAFTHDAEGRPADLLVTAGRVRNVRFVRE